jgi:hypothetical protein
MSVQEAAIVVDKHGGWRVIRISPLSLMALAGTVLFGGSAGLSLALGIAALVKIGSIGDFVFFTGFAIASLLFLYGVVFSYYVAFDEYHVVKGRRLRNPGKIVPRPAVSYLTWEFLPEAQRVCGVLRDEDGNKLMIIGALFSDRRLALIARELGIPFRT